MTQDAILRDMLAARDEIDRAYTAFSTLDEALASVERQVAYLRELQRTPREKRQIAHCSVVRRHTLTVMAVSYRLLRDLGLETAGDAAGKDIPF